MSGLNLLNQYIALRGIDIVSKGDIPQLICDQVFAGLIEYDDTLDKILQVIVQDELSQKTPANEIIQIEKMILQNVETPIVTYEILKVLGEGGFGIVYEVLSSSEEYQALKVYNDTFPDSGIRETSFSSLISHPNVVSITDCFFGSDRISNPDSLEDLQKDQLFAVMNVADGDLVSMAKNIKDHLCPILQILCGIHAIHSLGLIHGDIKPENVLLFGDVFKISDLDLLISTDRKLPIGTPSFWSPEKYITGRNSFGDDVWAAGLTFLEMIYGIQNMATYKTPQKEIDEVVRQIKDPQIRVLVGGMLQRKPHKRWTIEKCVGYMHSMCIEENHEPQKTEGDLNQRFIISRAKILESMNRSPLVTLLAASIVDRYVAITKNEEKELIDVAVALAEILQFPSTRIKIKNTQLAIDVIRKLHFKLYIQTQSLLNLQKNGNVDVSEALKRPQLQEVRVINYKIDPSQLFGNK